jgi:hypothetical protein
MQKEKEHNFFCLHIPAAATQQGQDGIAVSLRTSLLQKQKSYSHDTQCFSLSLSLSLNAVASGNRQREKNCRVVDKFRHKI